MMLRLFILFYDLELIEEDAYMKWKEDINDEYPGKGKALFQVCHFNLLDVTFIHIVLRFGIDRRRCIHEVERRHK